MFENRYKILKTLNTWTEGEGWELLFYYNFYRVGLAFLVLLLVQPSFDLSLFTHLPASVSIPVSGMLILACITFYNIHRKRPALYIQTHCILVLDIFFISLLTFSGQLVYSSIIAFYVTTVSASAVFFRMKLALAYAATCGLIILINSVIEYDYSELSHREFYYSALTAIGLFSIAFVVAYIARQSRRAQKLVEKQEIDLADLDQVNQIIIDNLEIGTLFITDDFTIRSQNSQSNQLLATYIQNDQIVGLLADKISELNISVVKQSFLLPTGSNVLKISTHKLHTGVLLRVEDQTVSNQRIQQTKLASLGRMASAIAHEIRNPLSAINHAAGLLKQEKLSKDDAELVEIIRKHSKRIDRIISSVLETSRPEVSHNKTISLTTWLNSFIVTFRQTIADIDIIFNQRGKNLVIRFDPSHLEQIITNICQNSIKYGKPENEPLIIEFCSAYDNYGAPYMDISDNGPGVETSKIDSLFEPFYTTDSRSTGLGLFLVREFCSLNNAEIQYHHTPIYHAFRMTFKPANQNSG